jgi:hypothetical protein
VPKDHKRVRRAIKLPHEHGVAPTFQTEAVVVKGVSRDRGVFMPGQRAGLWAVDDIVLLVQRTQGHILLTVKTT